MVGVILCTHSEMAAGMEKSVEMIIGPQEHFAVISFYNGDDPEGLQEKLSAQVEAYRSAGLLPCVLVDLLGASPFNAALTALAGTKTHVIPGVNLPLLLDLLLSRETIDADNITDFLTNVVNSAKDGIMLFNAEEI